MVKNNVAKLTVPESASPIIPAPKKDSNLRFRVDYREKNAATVRDIYQILRMDECIDSHGFA